MNPGITRRVVRILYLLGIGTLAVIGYAIAGIVTVLGAMGAVPPLLALLVAMPVIWVSSVLAAHYLTHVGKPAWDGA